MTQREQFECIAGEPVEPIRQPVLPVEPIREPGPVEPIREPVLPLRQPVRKGNGIRRNDGLLVLELNDDDTTRAESSALRTHAMRSSKRPARL